MSRWCPEVKCDGQMNALEAGGVIVCDCRIGGNRLRSSSTRAAYILRRFRKGEAPE